MAKLERLRELVTSETPLIYYFSERYPPEPLYDRPLSDFVKYVIPRIYIYDECWAWIGRQNTINKGTPYEYHQQLISVPVYDPKTFDPKVKGKKNIRKTILAHRYVASFFWFDIKGYDVKRDSKVCTQYNCVKPSHLIVGYHNQPV